MAEHLSPKQKAAGRGALQQDRHEKRAGHGGQHQTAGSGGDQPAAAADSDDQLGGVDAAGEVDESPRHLLADDLVVAAAEVAVGLAIILAIYRGLETIDTSKIDLMKW